MSDGLRRIDFNFLADADLSIVGFPGGSNFLFDLSEFWVDRGSVYNVAFEKLSVLLKPLALLMYAAFWRGRSLAQIFNDSLLNLHSAFFNLGTGCALTADPFLLLICGDFVWCLRLRDDSVVTVGHADIFLKNNIYNNSFN